MVSWPSSPPTLHATTPSSGGWLVEFRISSPLGIGLGLLLGSDALVKVGGRLQVRQYCPGIPGVRGWLAFRGSEFSGCAIYPYF